MSLARARQRYAELVEASKVGAVGFEADASTESFELVQREQDGRARVRESLEPQGTSHSSDAHRDPLLGLGADGGGGIDAFENVVALTEGGHDAELEDASAESLAAGASCEGAGVDDRLAGWHAVDAGGVALKDGGL